MTVYIVFLADDETAVSAVFTTPVAALGHLGGIIDADCEKHGILPQERWCRLDSKDGYSTGSPDGRTSGATDVWIEAHEVKP